MPVLSENGMNDIAYELLFQRRNPSWMYSIDNGATTIWERWNSYTLDCGIAKGGMTSFNTMHTAVSVNGSGRPLPVSPAMPRIPDSRQS